LLQEIDKTLSRPKNYLYAVFVDFMAAFDLAPRALIPEKLAPTGAPTNVLRLLMDILQDDELALHDGVSVVGEIQQTTGVAQGDNLSPLLFSLLVSDLPDAIRKGPEDSWVKVLPYADDLAICSCSRVRLQEALGRLARYTAEAGLTSNQA